MSDWELGTPDWTLNAPPVLPAPAVPSKRVCSARLIRRITYGMLMQLPTRPMPVCCECCGAPRAGRQLHLDHDHQTGAFRGWLCGKCNSAIGLLGDTIQGVGRALTYLRTNGDGS